MVTVRLATASDADFLADMLALATDWRPDVVHRPAQELMKHESVSRYLENWPADGDVGFVAEDPQPVGAAWWHFFAPESHGHGFVNAQTPELCVGVVEDFRGQGIGELLLRRLLTEGTDRGLSALSLNVDRANPAIRLYQRLGFRVMNDAGESLTMALVFKL